MPFSEIIGQERALDPLRAALGRGALHHAYLFAGPEGVGKGTAARLLAQAANCERVGGEGPPAPMPDPCGECLPCRKIARGVHPDVVAVASIVSVTWVLSEHPRGLNRRADKQVGGA